MEPLYRSPKGPISPIDILYGHRGSMEEGNLFMAHKTGFTAQSLLQSLCNAGFNVAIKARSNHFDLWAIASVAQTEAELKTLALDYFPPQ